MLRAILIYLSKADWARRFVQTWGIARRMAARFVAGETQQDAIKVIDHLSKKGINATLDHLGEHVVTEAAAQQAADEILAMIDHLAAQQVRAGISIKLSQIGLVLDQSLCRKLLGLIAERAKQQGIFIRIDMENSQVTEQTIAVFSQVHQAGCQDTIGIVLQSYLYRSMEDLCTLLASGAKVRICKGAYKEPSEVAYPKKRDVDENFDRMTAVLLDASFKSGSTISKDGIYPPVAAIATHDQARINFAKDYAEKLGLDKTGLEFQLLYGIRNDLQEALTREGYPVRVYVPYGTEWYPYFVRRLAERPANLWFFLSNLLRG